MPERFSPASDLSDAAFAASSNQLITLFRISARATLVVVFPVAGGHNVQRESSEGCLGTSKFQTVNATGIVTVPLVEVTTMLPVYVPNGLPVVPSGMRTSTQ